MVVDIPSVVSPSLASLTTELGSPPSPMSVAGTSDWQNPNVYNELNKISRCQVASQVFFPMENDWVFIVMSQNVDQKSIICWICFFSSGWIVQFAGCVASTHLNHCFCRITTNLWEPRFPLAPNVLAYIRLKLNTIGFSLLIFLDSVLLFHREISSPAGMAKDAKRRPLLECGESDSCVLPYSLNSSGFGDETFMLETSAWLTRRVLAAAVAEAPCWRKRFVHILRSRYVRIRAIETTRKLMICHIGWYLISANIVLHPEFPGMERASMGASTI